MDELFVNSGERPWQHLSDGPRGLHRKVLRTGPDGNPKVALLKLDPGFEMDAHSHAHGENHYVLEGMYESQGRECPAGTYRLIPKHKEHGPFRSPIGALVLVVWED